MSVSTRKVLLMGRSAAGKTSMKSVIFSNYSPKGMERFSSTVGVEMNNIDFLGNLKLNVWDCGGQALYTASYVNERKPFMFQDVEVMVYVFDVEHVDRDLDQDYRVYLTCLDALRQHSPSAKVFCLVHKMDLINPDLRDSTFEERQAELVKISAPTECRCYKSSIYQNTLYTAWSSIVYELVPEVKEMEQRLFGFAEVMEYDEVLLMERVTFLVVFRYRKNQVAGADHAGSEQVSKMLKCFQKTCQKNLTNFNTINLKHSKFVLVVDLLTPHLFIVVVVKDPRALGASIIQNIGCIRKNFEKFEKNAS